MSRNGKAAAIGLTLLALAATGRAAFDPNGTASPSGLEVVVVEAEGCIYCRVFRRDVLPAYESSPRARLMPMRFADVAEVEGGAVSLESPIDIVPTVLILQGREEIGRVAGYVGAEGFFHTLDRLLAGAR